MRLPVNQIICGNCLEVMADWPDNCVDLVLTDPPWPDTDLFDGCNPVELFGAVSPFLNKLTNRAIIILGCDKNPAMLSLITIPFFRLCWLRYARPHYKGRILYSSDIAYVYGKPLLSIPGRHVFGGECVHTNSRNERFKEHPCPRSLQHMTWLVKNYSNPGDIILDMFSGVGTTCVAAKRLGRRYIGIDISEKYCEIARQRIKAVDTGVPVKEQRQGQKGLFSQKPTG